MMRVSPSNTEGEGFAASENKAIIDTAQLYLISYMTANIEKHRIDYQCSVYPVNYFRCNAACDNNFKQNCVSKFPVCNNLILLYFRLL